MLCHLCEHVLPQIQPRSQTWELGDIQDLLDPWDGGRACPARKVRSLQGGTEGLVLSSILEEPTLPRGACVLPDGCVCKRTMPSLSKLRGAGFGYLS